jgi:hypothetical protein
MKKYRNEIIIIFINLFIVSLFCFTNIFGSTMDFLTQHIVFPNYLRELFYSSGKIIPNFMAHMGAGQNIFNIAYYGLMSPIILFSYFFPFIKMIDYIVISNIILLIISNLLFYRFLKYSFNSKMSLFLTLLFSFSGPILFHFHRHFMFVNYMPFLLLGLINVNKGKWNRVIIDVFLIIMASFYYSIPSIICLIIYYAYINFDSFNFKSFLKFLSYIFVSILMSSILLLPTFYSILSSRAGSSVLDLSLLFPNFDLSNILYGAYSTGLSSILIIGILYLFYSKKKNNLFLGIIFSVMFFIPIFMLILNGGLYVRGKCFIPFIPLLVYIIGLFFSNISSINVKRFLLFVLGFNLIVLFYYHNFLYYIDLLFVVLLIIFYKKFKIKYIFGLLLILDFVLCINLNLSENFIPNNYDFNYSFKSNDYYRVSNLNNDFVNVNGGNYISSFYSSTGNKYYNNLYRNIFKVNNSSINSMFLNSSSNVLFNEFMGNKYIISDYDIGYPYEKIGSNVYVLNQVYPIGYVNHNTINKDYFNSLEYPYNLDLLLNYVVTDDSSYKPISNIKEVDLDYSYDLSNSYIDNGKLYVNSDDIISIHINNDMSDKILFISLNNQEEQSSDISMIINGQENILTHKGWRYPNNNFDFNYCIGGSNDLEIKVSPGVYNVSDIHTYVLDNSLISSNDFDLFNIDIMNSDEISGSIDVTHSGYFILKVPYDKGFKVILNGDIIDYSMVDNSFIGFYLNKGFYNIRVLYEPPYLNYGKCLSIVGFVLFICLYERRKK